MRYNADEVRRARIDRRGERGRDGWAFGDLVGVEGVSSGGAAVKWTEILLNGLLRLEVFTLCGVGVVIAHWSVRFADGFVQLTCLIV